MKGKTELPDDRRLLTAQGVSDYLGIYPSEAENLMKNGEILSFEIGSQKKLRTTKEMIEIFISQKLRSVKHLKAV